MMRSIPRIVRSEFFMFDNTGPGFVSRTLAEYSGARDQWKCYFERMSATRTLGTASEFMAFLFKAGRGASLRASFVGA